MRVKLALLVLGLLLAAGIGLYATFQSRYLTAEHERARLVSLQQTSDALDALEKSGPATVGVGLDSTLFRNLGSALVGKKLVLKHPGLPGETLTVTINRFALSPQLGWLASDIVLNIQSDKRSASVSLDVECALYFSGVTRALSATADQQAVFGANFKLLPLSIEPKIAFGFLNLVGRGFVSDIVTAGVVGALSEKLTLSVPYRPEIEYTLDENKTFEQKFGDGNKGTLKYRVSHKPVSIARWVHVVGPIFTERGVVLAATLNEQQARPFEQRPLNNKVDAEIVLFEQKLAGRVAVAEQYYTNKQLTVSISSGAISSLTTEIANKLKGLSLTLASTEVSGRLFDKHWSDKILGDGGIYVEAAGGDRVHGSVNVRTANFTYVPGKGLEGNVALSIDADADLHVHVDPLIGGGVGTTIKIKGSSNPAINARIATSTFKFENTEVALIAPVLTCTAVDVKLATDGKLKIGSGWTTVPSIGVTTGELIGREPLDPTVISGTPAAFPVVAKSDPGVGADHVVITQGLYLSVEANALSVEAAETAYRFCSNLSLQVTDQAPHLKELTEQEQRLRAAAKEYWRNAMKSNCPDKPSLRVQVGDLEFGPNNEIIKFIKNAWNDITKGPGKENEIRKLVDRINAASKDYDEETRKLASEVGDAARNLFPKNNDIGHAAGELAKSATKAITNPVGAAGDFGKQLLNGFK